MKRVLLPALYKSKNLSIQLYTPPPAMKKEYDLNKCSLDTKDDNSQNEEKAYSRAYSDVVYGLI